MSTERRAAQVIRIPPYQYIHVLNKNDNVTRLVTGPRTYIRQEHEQVVQECTKMVTLAAQEYCIIRNPAKKDTSGEPILDQFGQVRLAHGDVEYRFVQDPFPLYPGETLAEDATPMRVVTADQALLLRAIMDFQGDDGEGRLSGDLWLFEGPGTYRPRKEVEIVEQKNATEVKPNTALKLRATKNGKDSQGRERVFGEEWLVKELGAYMPGPYEEIVAVINAVNLNEKTAIRMRALRTHTDEFGKQRKHGSEWLVTLADTESLIPSVHAEIVQTVPLISLTNRDYCVIVNPVDANFVPQFGKRRLVKGEATFFLQPGEELENGIQAMYILAENEALILRAIETVDGHQAGEKWMLEGPAEFVPPVQVEVIDRRSAIPLDDNEGIYVRDVRTGKVRAITGKTYILNQDEELWQKSLPPAVEAILAEQRDPLADRGAYVGTNNVSNVFGQPVQQQRRGQQQNQRPFGGAGQALLGSAAVERKMDLTRVVTYQVPHNAAVQVYDYKEKRARVIFGPDLVMLGPDEQFTQLSLSGGKPKRPNVIKALCLLLGPDFCTDLVTVETADHARLSLQLSYNWHFDTSATDDEAEAAKLFSVPDFIGDACKAIASRVRGTVAAVQFDDFHKNSARIIRSSVFGLDTDGRVKEKFVFPQNNMVITSIDVQSVEPVDQRTRDALQKSVQLAIEITTNSQEAAARHEAERLEQEARGRLERQKIEDEAQAEKSRRELLELQVQSAALESTGQAKAEAQSRAEAAHIEGKAAVESAKFKAEAMEIEAETELRRIKLAREAELEYLGAKNELRLKMTGEENKLETAKFVNMLNALGADNLRLMACAGPDQDVRMLKALGLNSTLITDGSSPVNLLHTAHGLIGQMMGKPLSDPKSAQGEHGDPIKTVTVDDLDVELA